VTLPWSLRALRRLAFPHKLGILDRLYGRRLSRHRVAWVATPHGPVWKLDLTNVCHRWVVYGDYQGPVLLRWAKRWLEEGGVVIDSGANIGQTVQTFGALAGVQVYAFEPNPEAADWLQSCLARQRSWSVELIHGLSDCAATLPLIIPVLDADHGARGTLQQSWYPDERRGTAMISVRPLDTFLQERGIASVRLWKLDVEGWELNALRGAAEVLAKRRIDAIWVEVQVGAFEDVSAFLASCGYRLYMLGTDLQMRPVTEPVGEMADLIALPA
jgi:FkbM family methyltransferase